MAVLINDSQLRWRCRRGVRELDVLLERFLQKEYPSLDEPAQHAFQRMLEMQDPTIMDCLFGKTTSEDQEIQSIIIRLQKLSGL